MPLSCDDLRAQAADLHRLAAERMTRAIERGRFAPGYTAEVMLVAQVESAAEKVEAEIVDRDRQRRDA